MMAAALVVSLVTLVASLYLAIRGLRSHGLTFERGAMMAVAWSLIIALAAFIASRLGY